MGDINDYAIEKLKETDAEERKISERLEMDHPRKYIPGAIHRLKVSMTCKSSFFWSYWEKFKTLRVGRV